MHRAKPKRGQLRLPIARQRFPDRNLHKGGRSFYFFDFDDNVMSLATPIYIFEHGSGREVALSTGHFAQVSHLIGKPGPYANFYVDLDDTSGSFRRFRDLPEPCLPGTRQYFEVDLAAALGKLDVEWKGPSWDLFEHAVHNARPLAIITARGHHPRTLEAGIQLLFEAEHISRLPNYLGLYPVSHAATRCALGDDSGALSVAALKKAAIHHAVAEAMGQYGRNEHHRFGMSDDSPENVALALEAFRELKRQEYPNNAFFVFDASGETMVRIEVLRDGSREEELAAPALQLGLFGSE